MALCAFNFGFDVGNFGGVLAMQREIYIAPMALVVLHLIANNNSAGLF